MENFIVSARKYRPANFNTVVGQQSITSTLKNAIKSDQLAQAFLFCGPRGVGKTTCARILAKTINCKNPTEDMEPCNECSSCVSFNDSASFNVHELDAASNNSVDDIRNLIDQVRIPPQDGKYKVYIIDEVHMLSQAAFNAFLKTLEEPPAYAKFILATTEKHKILPTILSRCQIYDFKRITISDIAKHLAYVAEQEKITAEADGLHVIAEKADGALRDALSIFDQIVSFAGSNFTYEDVINNLNVLDHDYYFRLMDNIVKQDVSATLLILNDIIDSGFDAHHFINGLGNHLRNLLVCKDPSTLKLLETSEAVKEKYTGQSKSLDIMFLLNSLSITNQCDIDYKSANNKRLHVEIALMQIISLFTSPNPGQKNGTIISFNPKSFAPKVEGNKEISKSPGSKVEVLNSGPRKVTSPQIKKDDGVRIIGSAHELEQKLKKEDSIVTETEAVSDEDIKAADKINQTDFKEAWDEMITKVDVSTSALSTVKLTGYQYDELQFKITIPVMNDVVKTSVLKARDKMVAWLRHKLECRFINMQVIISDKKIETKLYNPEEKFDKLVEKNPELLKFKNTLELDLEL
jgi:DNA polymerase-3 subunit gamma/tau